MDKKINEADNPCLYDLDELENKVANMKKALDNGINKTEIEKTSYIKEMDKYDDYRLLYYSVEAAIVYLFKDCKDKKLIKKYEEIVSKEMGNLSIYSEENKFRLLELKKELIEHSLCNENNLLNKKPNSLN